MEKLSYNHIDRIVEMLNNGKIIALPTDTIYGLACIFDNIESINNIYSIKGRDYSKPLIMMVSDIEMLDRYCVIDQLSLKLINKFMPGPLTVILNKKDIKHQYYNRYDTIGIRIPNNRYILDIIRVLDKPILVTSANKSNSINNIRDIDVIDDIGIYIDGIVLGSCSNNIGSTIVDVNDDKLILREGIIKEIDIRGVL